MVVQGQIINIGWWPCACKGMPFMINNVHLLQSVAFLVFQWWCEDAHARAVGGRYASE